MHISRTAIALEAAADNRTMARFTSPPPAQVDYCTLQLDVMWGIAIPVDKQVRQRQHMAHVAVQVCKVLCQRHLVEEACLDEASIQEADLWARNVFDGTGNCIWPISSAQVYCNLSEILISELLGQCIMCVVKKAVRARH